MSRKCSEALEQVYVFLDEEMTWYRRIRVRRHLRKCSGCMGSFDFEARIIDVVRRKGVEPAPPELIDRLRAFIREHGSDGEVGA